MSTKSILIIGGGIGGLMTSIALNKQGISTTICEKSGSFDLDGAGLALWPNATRILEEHGLLDKLLPYGNVLDKMKTCTANGKVLNLVRLGKLADTFNFPSVVVLRSDLQRVLSEAVPAAQIQFNKKCVRIESDAKQTTAHFEDGSKATADIVVFADGIHSIARKTVFEAAPLRYAGRASWRGIAQFDRAFFNLDTNLEIFGPGRRIGIFPLPDNKAYWYAAVNMPEAESFKQKRSVEGVLSHFKAWSEPVETLVRNTAEDRLILTNIHYTNSIRQLVKGNIVLLGDAAHPMTPDLGQGACQAIEDAYFLSQGLSREGSIAEGLKWYEKQRLGRVQAIAKNSYRMGYLRQLENPVGLALRNRVFKMLPERFALKMLEQNIRLKR